ncbi:MAG: HD domain-containing protein [Lachnospiraceae bacterium]|nr:HD domain-containing protein [Lachnospiraceae bacterium]
MNNQKMSGFFEKHKNLTAFILSAAGVGLNMLLSLLTEGLGLPLYLDAVGTVVVATAGGSFPGVLVGFVTNILKTIRDPAALYYGILNVLIAVVTAFFVRKGWHKKLRGLIGMVLVFTLIGGGIGALIPWFMEGLTFGGESLSGVLYEAWHLPPGMAHFLSGLITDLPDKVITVLLAVLILHLIPAGAYDLFGFSMWMQKALDTEEMKKRGKTNVRRVSLRIKTLIVLIFSMTTVALVCALLSARVFRKMTLNERKQIAIGTVNLAASEINPGHIRAYLMNRGRSAAYRLTKERLERILAASPDVAYICVYKPLRDGLQVVFDIDKNGGEGIEAASVIPYDKGFAPQKQRFLKGEEIDPVVTDDENGYLLTVAVPVYDEFGGCVCYAIADVDMQKLNADGLSFLTEMVSVFLGFFILLCTFTIWLTDYQIILPLNVIARGMDKLSKTSDDQESMDADVRAFRSLGIHTGDELENLYLSASSMTRNQAEQMRSIRKLSDSTEKLQDGLIITMADLVESRDSDTGAHVQKTSAYAEIIVKGLKKKGYYAQKITPTFMSDVVRSAPLHDIGKINIPDFVLNKPGKLTDEEYEIMKTHTTAGKEIMEKVISTVEGDNYLKEARNMAAYHHERWDGKGYPEGLRGEMIPLSARIMAVADVFDALASPRVYKPAFPIEKAVAIMQEGSGTQFDPKCLEVFLDAIEEVTRIRKKFGDTAKEDTDV